VGHAQVGCQGHAATIHVRPGAGGARGCGGALRNPHLRCAADSYDRAARTPYGRLPRRGHDGDQLRRTARLIALAGNLTGDTTLAAIALVAQLAPSPPPWPSCGRHSSTRRKQQRPALRPPTCTAP
jgi:hypothetical protein